MGCSRAAGKDCQTERRAAEDVFEISDFHSFYLS
jgi:hypothetical protein